MTTRHTGVLTALLLTAALMCAMPGLWSSFWQNDSNRMADSLRPARMRTLTVWLLPGELNDRKCLSAACAAFEKAHAGARIFLRSASAEEFHTADAVLPDVVLFEPGALNEPEGILLPLEEVSDSCGMYALQRYAVPLWLEPYVLTLPESWLTDDGPAWMQAAAQLELPDGLALQQLLFSCPAQLRGELVELCLQAKTPPDVTEAAAVWSTTLPISRSTAPTPTPQTGLAAKVQTLAQHLASGESAGFLLRPAISDRVRCAALCSDTEDARAFLQFLLEWPADAAKGLLPLHTQVSPEGFAGEAAAFYHQGYVLPNVFSHTVQERREICRDAFRRAEDPALTILRLR